MFDINFELRTSYFSALSGNIFVNGNAIPIYYSQAPLQSAIPPNPDNYVIISALYSTNFNDDKDQYLITTVQLMIVTKSYQNNAGMIKDVIASQILSIVSPNVRDNPIQIVSGQVFDTKLFTDVEQTGLNDGEKKVINRILSIRHQIKLEANSNVLNNIYFGTQSTNADPVDFSNIANVNPTLPLSIDYGTQDAPIFFWLAVNSTFSVKTDWDDLNDDGNSGKIGADTDLFEIRDITIDSVPYKLYITRYETGFNGVSAQVRYY